MPAVAGTRLADLTIAVAREVGTYYQPVLTSLGVSGIQAVSAQLIDSEAPAERYGGYYLFSHGPSVINEQHRVLRTGFVGATGALTVNGSYSAQPAAGTVMSLCGAIPMIAQDGILGIRECVNRALRRLWIRRRMPIVSAGPSVISYDLGALWWAHRRRFLALYDPDTAGLATGRPSAIDWDVVADGEVWTLLLAGGFPLGQTFTLEVDAPANSRLYRAASGTWADQASPTAALDFDNDAMLGEWNGLYQATLLEVYRALAIQAGGSRKSYWRERAQEQQAIVAAMKQYEMTDEPRALGAGPALTGSGTSGWGLKGLFDSW